MIKIYTLIAILLSINLLIFYEINKFIKNVLHAGSVAFAMVATPAVSEKHDSVATQAEIEANITMFKAFLTRFKPVIWIRSGRHFRQMLSGTSLAKINFPA